MKAVKKITPSLLIWKSGIAAIAFLAGSSAYAQEQASAGAVDADGAGTVTDIVVTAQLRKERRQEVPVSIQVLGSEALTKQNLTSLTTASQVIPSVYVSPGSGRGASLYIRGTGSGANQSFDQSVGIFIDGIYHGRSRTTAGTFLDLERLEVLKGPQSTFFGNNAIAGAFNIATRQPGHRAEGWVRALIAPGGKNGGQYALEGATTIPLAENVSLRLAGTFNGQKGWVEIVNLDKRAPKERNLVGRATLRYDPSDDFDITLKGEVANNRNDFGFLLQPVNCPPPAPYTASGYCSNVIIPQNLPVGLEKNIVAVSDGQTMRIVSHDATLTINKKMGDHVLSSITGYYDFDFLFNTDLDQTPIRDFTSQLPETYRQWSQEFRIASPTGGALEYLAGIYYQDDHLNTETDFNYYFLNGAIGSTPALAPLVPYRPLGQVTIGVQDERVMSAFGSLTWNVSDRLKLSAGLRASRVRKTFDWHLFYGQATQDYGGIVPLPADVAALPLAQNPLSVGTAGQLSFRRTDDALMPSIRAQYKFSSDVMAYASYSRGFKAGGFNVADNTANPANFPFSPEHVDAYEVGLKSEFFNRRVLLNIAAFLSDYRNLQVSINEATAAGAILSLVRNAAASRAQGVEVESQFRLTDRLRLSGAMTWLDSYYRDYRNGPPTTDQTRRGITSQDLSGQTTPFAPKWSGNVTGTYETDIGSLLLTTEATALFRTGYDTRFGNDPFHREDGYVRLDARISLGSQDGRWAFDIIGKNLTDRTILLFSSAYPRTLGSQYQQKEQPRNISFQVRYSW